MEQKLTITLFNESQGYKEIKRVWIFVKELLASGQRLVLEIRPISKTRDQEKKYHAMIGEVSVDTKHLGSKWEADDWKRLLLDKFARETGKSHGAVIPNLDNSGVVQVGIQSKKFTKAEAIEFIEWLSCWGAENGVTFKGDECLSA